MIMITSFYLPVLATTVVSERVRVAPLIFLSGDAPDCSHHPAGFHLMAQAPGLPLQPPSSIGKPFLDCD